jgi:hypothetical protein
MKGRPSVERLAPLVTRPLVKGPAMESVAHPVRLRPLNPLCPSANVIRRVIQQLTDASLPSDALRVVRRALIRTHRDNCRYCRCSPRDERAEN